MPLLYVNDLAAGALLAMDTAGRSAHQGCHRSVIGAAGLEWIIRLVVGRRRGCLAGCLRHGFPDPRPRKGIRGAGRLFKSALDRIRNSVVNANEPEKDGARNLAYGLYVLARNGAAPIGDLRYLADTKLNNLATPIAKSQLAAALALVGDRARAERVYAAALESARTKACDRVRPGRLWQRLARCRGTGVARQRRQRAAGDADASGAAGRSGARADALHLDPGECLDGAGGARARQGNADARYRRAPIKTALFRSYKAAEMAGKPVKITNTGDAPVQAVVSVIGPPITPEPAASNGFKIERNYFTLDGKPADVSKAKQNDRFAVVLKITEAKPEFGHIMVSDYLPAGLEIDNPHLVSSGDTGTLDWIEDGEEPENTEFRDDRFTAAIDRASDDKAVFTVAYVVRAVSPGKYVLPQAYVEDMYNPSRYGRTGTGSVEVRPAK